MELPRTREEFTQWALEHAGTPSFAESFELDEPWQVKRFEAWVEYVYDEFPDLVQHCKCNSDVKIYFANVVVLTTQAIRLFEFDLLGTVVRHHWETTGEFL